MLALMIRCFARRRKHAVAAWREWLLTGSLNDGTAGLHAVICHGGIAIVQDPNDALVPAMPQSALRNVKVDHCVPLAEMSALLVGLATKRNVPTSKKGKASMHGFLGLPDKQNQSGESVLQLKSKIMKTPFNGESLLHTLTEKSAPPCWC